MSSTPTSVHPPALHQLDDVGRALMFTDVRTPRLDHENAVRWE